MYPSTSKNSKLNNGFHSAPTYSNNINQTISSEQFCQNCKNYNLGSVSFSLCNECEDSIAGSQNENFLNDEPDELKLMEIAAKVVAQHYPFQFIEERYERIPEPVQRRIIAWSFPRDEMSIRMYSSLNSDDQKVSFRKGEHMLEKVHNVLQVGFHLSGTVLDTYNDREPVKKHRVSITFDRCKITSVTCSCDLKDIFWCPHVVALALYRIRRPRKVKLRVAISETLLQLDKCQLQKLVQFLISEHHTEVLPTAQSLADKMLNRNSILNAISGAPDVTAGAAIEQENCWHLDEQQITKKVTTYLSYDNYITMNKNINALFGKVKEMLKARDSNASRMLSLITEQFLSDRRLVSWRTQGAMSDKYRQLWDQLVALWVYIALNPHATAIERKKISDLLFNWIQNPNCPLEDSNYKLTSSPLKRKLAASGQISDDENVNVVSDDELVEEEEQVNEFLDNNNNNNNFNYNERRKSPQNNSVKNKRKKKRYHPRTIFHRALESSFLKWDDPHLKFIINEDEKKDKNENDHIVSNLTNYSFNKSKKNIVNSNCSSTSHQSSKLFNSQRFPLWNEPIPIACARVEALRCHGYQKSAIKLAVSIVRSMKRKQRELLNMQPSQSDVNRNTVHFNLEGYIGNPLDSISTLFDTLAEASLTQDSKPLEHYYGMFLSDNYAIINGNNNLSSSSPLEVAIPSFIHDHHHESIQRIIENNNQRNGSQSAFREKPRYLHKAILGCHNRDETYISLALEAALIGLGQQRLMPNSEYLQEKSLKQEERLIAKLNDIEYDATLLAVLRNQALLLLEGGPLSGFGLGIHPESVPMHNFAKFLFTSLLHYDNELAYSVGLRAMRLPILEGVNNFYEDLNNNNNLMNNNHLNRLNAFHNHLHHHHQLSNLYQNLNNNHHLYPFLPNNNLMPMNQNPIIYNRSNNGSNNNSANANGNSWNRWHVLTQIEQQQCQLATTMIYAARNDFNKLKKVQTEAQKHIHTSNYLFKLAQDAFRIAIPIDNTNANNNLNHNNASNAPLNILQTSFPRSINNSYGNTFNLNNLNNLSLSFATATAVSNFPLQHNHNLGQNFKNSTTTSYLLEVAFELYLQVIKMSQSENKRKEVVKCLINCAIEIGFSALYYLMQFWYNLFTPIEAVFSVATCIMNTSTISKANLTQREQESLGIAARQLAVDCTKKDPPSCAEHALKLCESDQLMFEKCYSIIEEAGIKGKMNFTQLMGVAKYMQSKCLEWAYKLSQLAIKTIQIGYNNDTSPLIGDITWACDVALTLGKEQLSRLIPILIENIHCAQILSNILHICLTGGLSYSNKNLQHSNQTNQLSSNNPYYINSNSFLSSGTNQHTNHQFSNHHSSSRRHHSHHLNNSNKMLALDKDPLKPLLDAAINCYVNATHSKLQVISPRHYSDFVDFLVKARETFLLASDGEIKFNSLIDTIRTTYKGKKKLMNTIKNKFPTN